MSLSHCTPEAIGAGSPPSAALPVSVCRFLAGQPGLASAPPEKASRRVTESSRACPP